MMVAVRVPAAVGVNFALYRQLAPGASVLLTEVQVPLPPQLKSPAESESLVIVNEAFPVLVKVVVRTGLVWPTVTLPKLMLVGFRVRMPAAAFTVTVALADLVLSATLVAFTVTVFVAVTVGAVNSPVVLTVPEVADQVTAVLLVFVT
jgi:hypothetical protein